jgi:predicted flap endonuclease-1-like 5' DNA nuclease/predicted  nucleic acid-binding Zn-ribbon protein
LAEWQEKYKNLDLDYKQIESEQSDVTKAYETYKSSTSSEIEKLSGHLTALQNQLEESTSYSNEYAAALTDADEERKELAMQLEQQKANATKELMEIQQHLQGLEADYQTIQEREELLDDRFVNLQDKHADLEDSFKNTVEEKDNLEIAYQEYKKTTKKRFDTLENEAKNWVDKLDSANLELAHNKDKAAELEQNKKQLIKELDKMRERYDQEMNMSGGEFEALNDTFDDLKSKYFDVNKELSSTKLEKERIYHEHQSYQEQILVEMQLIRNENKKLAKNITSIKIEKRKLEYSNEELLERIEELEEQARISPAMGQDKLIKMINRLRLNVEEQSQIINDFSKERKQYLHKIKTLQETLGGGTNTSPVHAEKSQPSDNLKQINGIGNMTEETLNDFGIYSYAQLASISNDNKALLSQVISSTPDKITIWAQEAQKLLEKE